MFQIVDLDTSAPIMQWDSYASRHELRLFATGQEAAQVAKDLTEASPGKKFQPRPYLIDSAAWQQRERDRFQTGFYAKPVWHDAPWYQEKIAQGGECATHFCHVSSRDKSRVAYTATEEKGAQDIQTPARPGSYLKKFFGTYLSDSEIQHWTMEHDSQVGGGALKFAATPESIDYVYRNGPRSCMNNKQDYPRILNRDIFPLHPCHIYAAGDLSLAYIEQGANQVSARCIVWPSKKLYGRIYGNASCYNGRLQELLLSAGYTYQNDWNFEGARLLKVRNSYYGNFTMPYVDGSCYVHDSECGKFFVIGRGRGRVTYSCSNTSGTTEHVDEYEEEDYDERPCCERCDERYDDGEGAFIRDREQYWCEYCAEQNATQCEATGDWFYRDYVTLADGTVWGMPHYESHGGSCEDCSESFDYDDLTCSEHDELTRCDSCHESHESDVAENAEIWRVATYSILTGEFIGYAAFDLAVRETGTESEARELIARLSDGQIYYRFEIENENEDSYQTTESRNVAA